MMFNQFARAARLAVLDAARVARDAPAVTDEHLLLALVAQRQTASSEILDAAGVTAEKVAGAYRAAERRGGLTDAEARSLLDAFGIDVDRVLEQVGALEPVPALASRRSWVPFGGGAKAVIKGALREAAALRERELRDEHLLLAIAAAGGVGGEMLAEHGLTYAGLRARLVRVG